MTVPQYLDYGDFVVNSEIRKYEYLKFVFIFQIVLAIMRLLNFHMNFRITFSISAKIANCDFDKYALNLEIKLEVIAI